MCEECETKTVLIKEQADEIVYLKALLALDSLQTKPSRPPPASIKVVNALQQTRLLQNQLLLIRADVQYLNGQVQAVLAWTSKIISLFLACCGRVPQETAGQVVNTALQ